MEDTWNWKSVRFTLLSDSVPTGPRPRGYKYVVESLHNFHMRHGTREGPSITVRPDTGKKVEWLKYESDSHSFAFCLFVFFWVYLWIL